jgi:hypothetical protein
MSQSSSSSASEYFSSVLLLVAPLFCTSYGIFSYIVYGNLYVSIPAGRLGDHLTMDNSYIIVTVLLSISRPSNWLYQFIGALATQFATPT